MEYNLDNAVNYHYNKFPPMNLDYARRSTSGEVERRKSSVADVVLSTNVCNLNSRTVMFKYRNDQLTPNIYFLINPVIMLLFAKL